MKFNAFTAAYIAAALQLSNDEIGGDWTIYNISNELARQMSDDCLGFLIAALSFDWLSTQGSGLISDVAAQAGTDFWLTRNGHGAGFWDRPEVYGEEAAEKLTELCKGFGECDLYLGDDGNVYMSPEPVTTR